ncbi:Cd(II)/Pb(II)-sensing metalloregulatory transcriptional regulator CmtR [Actinokineospora xionganensis]|uniref:Winged helix-turn-helix transcriptional regulator n=1 Tax=Actinokineospora xionganensis TaxID=2684470 RepID=A0ABR7LFA4_9PSEU|nr:metalloregulator ArsR/SmtB family transcription factor [Actinokineospora xionganensis]MBC6451278.1 winged helix-turn-helix transcriptional regulator [Actinokineospora xionganensis]
MLTCETRESALARLGRALADPTRCRILLSLLDGPGYPARLAEELALTRSNVSNHLSCLRGCGLVVAAYEGRQVRYELADAHLARALRELVDVVLAVDPTDDCADPA